MGVCGKLSFSSFFFFFLFFGKQRPVYRPLFLFLNSHSGSVKILKFVVLLRQCFGKIC